MGTSYVAEYHHVSKGPPAHFGSKVLISLTSLVYLKVSHRRSLDLAALALVFQKEPQINKYTAPLTAFMEGAIC